MYKQTNGDLEALRQIDLRNWEALIPTDRHFVLVQVFLRLVGEEGTTIYWSDAVKCQQVNFDDALPGCVASHLQQELNQRDDWPILWLGKGSVRALPYLKLPQNRQMMGLLHPSPRNLSKWMTLIRTLQSIPPHIRREVWLPTKGQKLTEIRIPKTTLKIPWVDDKSLSRWYEHFQEESLPPS